MRVTQSMITRNALIRVNQNRSKMTEAQNNISSGKKINKPSDDPTLYARINRLQNSLNQNEQYLSKVQYADGWITNSISMLEQISDLVFEVKDVAEKGADDQFGPEGRLTLASKLNGLIQESLAIANSQYLGKSVFAGTQTDASQPFVYNAGVISYVGNDEGISRSYSENIKVTINTTGQELMDTGLFDSMTNLYNALNNNDVTAIQTEMDNLDSSMQDILALTSDMGARQKTISMIQSRLEQSNVDISGFLSDARDANLDEEIVRFKAEELAFQASLQATSNVLKLNIMNYLG